VAVFDTGKIAAKQPGLFLDVSLREPFLETIRANRGPDLHDFPVLAAAWGNFSGSNQIYIDIRVNMRGMRLQVIASASLHTLHSLVQGGGEA
jgi:hypothetical protein